MYQGEDAFRVITPRRIKSSVEEVIDTKEFDVVDCSLGVTRVAAYLGRQALDSNFTLNRVAAT